MIRRILVPLDGSDLAEAALPAAAALAKRLRATVGLVHVLERHAPRTVHGRPHLGASEPAASYLQRIAASRFPSSVVVRTHVHPEEVADVARSISEHAERREEPGGDLIVMCTHGRGDLRQVLLGSLGQRVTALGSTPVILLRAGAAAAKFRCRSLLLPLDRREGHSEALDTGAELAASFKAAVHLLLIVPTYGTLSGRWVATGRFLPGTTSRLLDLSAAEEQGFLQEQTEALQGRGLAVSAEVRRGDPARSICRAAGKLHLDLIVLSTHGRIGLGAVWEGSVANKVCRNCAAPVLLVPVRRKP
jgi:nucleotide-binding universal stress UspA family protein